MFGSQLNCRFLAAILLPFATSIAVAQLNYYVAPNGSDTNNGLSATTTAAGVGPVATLFRARDLLRIQRQKGNTGPAYVRVRAGSYPLSQSFSLGIQDFNTTYMPYGDGTVRLMGGSFVNGWKPVTDPAILNRLSPSAQANVQVTNLPLSGVTDYGTIWRRSYFLPTPHNSPLELAFLGHTMKVAQYPNTGWINISGVFNNSLSVSFAPGTMSPTSKASDAWAEGYWNYDWADSIEPISSYDPINGTLTLSNLPPMGTAIGGRFRIANILEELDSPGEYYVDRSTGNLYFWPPSPITNNSCVVSTLESPVINMYLPVDITVTGFIIESSRERGVLIQGGLRTLVSNCLIRNMGREGISTAYGTTVNIARNDLYDLGNSGIIVHGGNVATMTSGGVVAHDNRIWNFGLIEQAYHPAISIQGFGNRADANQISQGPHLAIMVYGNNHLIACNEIFSVCTETGDSGAIYTGRDITSRGNLICFNYIHDCRGTLARSGTYTHVAGIYLDDLAGGFLLYRNTYANLDIGVIIGGGRNNTVNNDVFYAVDSAINIDARGKNWATGFFAPGGNYDQQIANLGPTAVALFQSAYPDFLSLTQATDKGLPANNMVLGSILPSNLSINYADPQYTRSLLGLVNNVFNSGSMFADPAHGDFTAAAGTTLPFKVSDKSNAGTATKTGRPYDTY